MNISLYIMCSRVLFTNLTILVRFLSCTSILVPSMNKRWVKARGLIVLQFTHTWLSLFDRAGRSLSRTSLRAWTLQHSLWCPEISKTTCFCKPDAMARIWMHDLVNKNQGLNTITMKTSSIFQYSICPFTVHLPTLIHLAESSHLGPTFYGWINTNSDKVMLNNLKQTLT